MARRVELGNTILIIPSALAARVAVLAVGSELLDLVLSDESSEGGDNGDSSESGSENGETDESSESDALLDLVLPYEFGSQWRQPGGRIFAATYLLPSAEAALRQELQRLADAAKRARLLQSSSSSGSRAT
jgi:hypothetical protein